LSSSVLTIWRALVPVLVEATDFPGPTPFASQVWTSIVTVTPETASVMVSSTSVAV
jgi:hypothetical protein